MVTRLKEVDAVTIGLGWTGAIMARELTKAGLNVVSLEKGQDRIPGEDFILPAVRDEVRYAQRLELMWDNSIDTLTFRNFPNEQALPIRRIGAFLPGEGVGGSGIHWGGLHWRFLPSDFRIRSALTERYGANALPDGMTIQDWPVSYDEMEPFYDRFDKICGVSGKAGNLRGSKIDGGNVFEGPRSDPISERADQIEQCRPDVRRSGKEPRLSSVPGADCDRERALYQCRRRGAGGLRILRLLQPHRLRDQRQGVAEFHHPAGAAPRSEIRDPHPLLRHQAQLRQGLRRKSSSVTYTDMRTGEEYEQPAGIVLLTSYVFSNVQHMLLAGIGEPYDHATGKGVVGKNYAYQFEAGANAFFEDKELNPYWGSAGMGTVIDDFNGETFDHGGLGFFGGGYIMGNTASAPPIAGRTRAARHAGVGLGMEARHREVVLPRRPLQHPGLGLCQPRQLHGPRPDLQGRARPAADPAHLQSARQRIQDVAPICCKSSKASSRR